MNKKVLIISTSLRTGSNSEALADEFAKGAVIGGHQAEKISLADKQINFCRGCLACQKTKRCVIRDDADTISQKMLNADVLAFATPIYYYEMCGQMKTLLDRANPIFAADYKFREVYLLTTAADTDENTPSRAVGGLEGWLECFPKARLAGTVFGGGVTDVGDIKNNPSLTKAYEMGKKI